MATTSPSALPADAPAHVDPTAEGAEVELTEEQRAARAAKNKAKREKAKAKKAAEKADKDDGPKLDPEEARKQLQMVMAERGQPMRGDGKSHEFWDTQPVMQLEKPFELDDAEGPLEQKTVAEVRQEPYELPDTLEWWSPDVKDPAQMQLVYELLRDHYVEDDDAMFRFNYPCEFLQWALLPPAYYQDWHVAIRSKEDKNLLVGFISGIPVNIQARSNTVRMCEINFLCVNKRCREKRLAPLLIQEVTRRVNLKGVWQAIYTAGIMITSTIAQCQYWHRSLNPEKLIAIRFSRIPPKFEKFQRPQQQVKKHYQLPEKPQIPGMRAMTKKDHKQVRILLENYLKKFGVFPIFTNDEICHWFLPREGVIDTFVVQAPDGKITDMCSFYHLPSTVIGANKYKTLRAAYSYYNVANTVTTQELMNDAMILAKQKDMDVFNALDIMDNKDIFKDLKFLIGDGNLRYYFYNWKFPELKASNIGVVLL
eukprot:TRINITY_DN9186_c0_g1_i1.p2 TRINITY_DN9186_c0_g1~~TRINITY_DN9186_c0_g1_i1.p2  ORF type:complete len:481 (+),score=249.17 TRINITY_DN9186_c0_g1_i1:51-1493(+)